VFFNRKLFRFCSSCEDSTESLRNQIKKLEDENSQKRSELSRLSAQLETERASAREDLNECLRRLDLAEADKFQLRDQLESKRRKVKRLTVELTESKNEVSCLAALLVKVGKRGCCSFHKFSCIFLMFA
jgi:predicted RNase H-like nuclease (RuvC/YqgF family)